MQAKRGQVTLFIIIAILVVAAVLLVFFLRGRAPLPGHGKEAEPKSYIEDCVKQYLKSLALKVEFKCGGEQIKCYKYAEEDIPYLCYSENPGENCKEIHPEQIMDEMLKEIKGNVSLCIDQSLKEMEKKGYTTKRCSENELEVNYIPTSETIGLEIKCLITLEKEKVMSYEKFEASCEAENHVSWGPYDVFKEAVQEIVKNESARDPATSEFFDIVEKKCGKECSLEMPSARSGDWTTIFILTKGNSKFKFAIKEVKVEVKVR